LLGEVELGIWEGEVRIVTIATAVLLCGCTSGWVREIVARFMTVVAREVPKRDPLAQDSPRVAKVIVTMKVGKRPKAKT